MEWIKLTDKEPEFEKQILVCDESLKDSVCICRLTEIKSSKSKNRYLKSYVFMHSTTYDENYSEVTHWMPLPEPPKNN